MTSQAFSQADKVAIVVGAGGGIDRAFLDALSRPAPEWLRRLGGATNTRGMQPYAEA
jgi:hypothetical protein